MSDSLWERCSIGQIQDLSLEIAESASSLSKRGKDAFLSVYKQCGEDVAALAYKLVYPDFTWDASRSGIGGKTLDELTHFSEDILNLLKKHKDAPGLEEFDYHEKRARFVRCGVDKKIATNLVQLESQLGYFPAAALVWMKLLSLNDRDSLIWRHGTYIWKDAHIKALDVIAEQLGITSERCRQVRSGFLDDLASFLAGLGINDSCPYDYLDKELENIVNNAEGTGFTADFIRFILGSAFPDLSVVGKTEDSLFVKMKGGTNDTFVAAVPTALAQKYDFKSFLLEIESFNEEKSVSVRYFQLPDWSIEAKSLAASLARLRYGWVQEGESLVVPPNADKNRPEIMEDIIRDAGHPLTIEEITSEYERRYPDRKTDPTKVRGNMQVNPKIIPIGRSGVYSLSEWVHGSARGGTIRSFVRECLDNSETHIVPAKEVFDYVRNFRPTTTDANILSNLMLDSEKSFRVIWKDGISYLNYTSESIPEGYKQLTRTICERRSFEESIAMLDDFIALNGQMPRSGCDPEQSRLARFISTQRSNRRRGLSSQKELDELQRIESSLKHDARQLELFPLDE